MGIIEIFIRPLFWIVMGALYAFVFYSARLWAKDLNLKMNPGKWLLVAIWFLMLSLTVAGGFTLLGENEVSAGFYFLGFFAIIHFILGMLLWRLVIIKREKKK